MNRKIKFIILIVAAVLFVYSLSSAAYFEPKEYRKSLLELRDAERALNNLDKNLKEAESDFRIIDKQTVESNLKELDSLYQELIQAYQQQRDRQVQELEYIITNKSDEIRMKIIESKPVQLRAFWLDNGTFARLNGRAGVQKLLDRAQKANFNVIFPETFYKGKAVIPDNKLFEQDSQFSSWEEDPLEILIEEAKKRKIEIHPWVWVFNENTSGSPGKILTENPEWANQDKEGNIVSYHDSTWLSPAREDVKDFLQQRYLYLVKNYDIQGINLDYIRFPEEYRGSFGYDKSTVEGFKEKYGMDPFQIKSSSSDFSLWNKYRENLVTEMVKEVSKKLKNVDPKLLISADVIPGREEARYRALQDWSLWLEKDFVDFVVPMTYTENLFSELRRWIKEDRNVLTDPLYPGISVFKLTPDQLIDQVEEVNRINPNGASLFAAAHLTANDYHSLSQGVYSEAALLPYKNKAASLKSIQKLILKRLELIKEKNKIDNFSIIKIRGYLNQAAQADSEIDVKFEQFIIDNKIELSENVMRVLKADFDYLMDQKRLY
ncbi:Uncharacterized lipoprotein YddW, UPF0748 family [Halanaerobium congolense]|jgi:uncharacterized lipoprotein YddW (UPF0748 family)|uniref:Uncharacterized lipoprotein YddW (UPF0748 family) n=1 Tax=Halanaerobium congolense TaxID=54121 RepID=A0A1G8M1X0_9FIRM|nr:family 10 glycosylhydrolase [Halanaerobium congolense]KXS49929.1 MAG: Uncharacterized protein AWL62_616 [Halanaerobium sp. T82-1]PUU90973.1 MAG: Uncharacterized protein CI948_1336 [Halanaerobium sp.]TDX41782.1 uncharacterized lipoprotein YddW (UPF0748 family) [Halanaerobium congolense]SDI61924.1 Uncharacterized lipoprotein YddW, UPF0748 family [Halanaerobium congolense]SET34089.1 Uncharacterized lipoprotein YddW, UPF0748 family [Halanaerobium congolense]